MEGFSAWRLSVYTLCRQIFRFLWFFWFSTIQHFRENIISKLYQKGQETLDGQRKRGKRVKEQRVHEGWRRRRKEAGKEVLQELEQMSIMLLRTHTGAGLSWRTAGHGGPRAAAEEEHEEEEQQRGAVRDWPQLPFPTHPCSLGEKEGGDLGMKLSLGKGEEERCHFNVWLYHYLNPFYLATD